MPLKPGKVKQAYDRDWYRRNRSVAARELAQDQTETDYTPPVAVGDQVRALTDWAATLKCPRGHPRVGKPMILPDYMIRYLTGALAVRESLLSVARKNAKSTGLALLALGYLCGPLRRAGWVWSNETHDFTPWLVKNMDRFAAALNLNLKDVETEKTLPGAGRVDIYALEEETNAPVVIENQLGWSDNDPCLRLLGYAASAEASILVWVARDFASYHQSVLRWLNETGKIDVYAVVVRAYEAGESLGLTFETVVEPDQSKEVEIRPIKRTMSTICAEFYRPLVKHLRQKGMPAMGRRGWAGRYRSFQADLRDSLYGTRVDNGVAQVFLRLGREHRHERLKALQTHREKIDRKIKGSTSWAEDGELWWDLKDTCHILLENRGPFSLTDPKEGWETSRQWMADSLFSLWNVLEPYLAELRQEEEATSNKED